MGYNVWFLGGEQAQETDSHIREQTQKHVDNYAREGLRTLCIARKVFELLKSELFFSSMKIDYILKWE